MFTESPPTFDEWVEYCFTLGMADFWSDSGNCEDSPVAKRERRFCELPSPIVIEYLLRLFNGPGFVAEKYNQKQIADGVYFIFGVASGYAGHLHEAPPEDQVKVYQAIETLYRELFDPLDPVEGSRLDRALFAVEDMDLTTASHLPYEYPYLVKPVFHVLQAVLLHCGSRSCQKSAAEWFRFMRIHNPGKAKELLHTLFVTKRLHPEVRQQLGLPPRSYHTP